jgi:hypothetical protein
MDNVNWYTDINRFILEVEGYIRYFYSDDMRVTVRRIDYNMAKWKKIKVTVSLGIAIPPIEFIYTDIDSRLYDFMYVDNIERAYDIGVYIFYVGCGVKV